MCFNHTTVMLTSISPIDGRYYRQVRDLSSYYSEFALIRYRVRVEIEYFIALCELPLPQLEGFDRSLFDTLRGIYRDMTEDDAAQVKEMLATDKLLTANAKAQLTAAVAALEEAATASNPNQETLDAKRLTVENLVNGLYTISVNGKAQVKGGHPAGPLLMVAGYKEAGKKVMSYLIN